MLLQVLTIPSLSFMQDLAERGRPVRRDYLRGPNFVSRTQNIEAVPVVVPMMLWGTCRWFYVGTVVSEDVPPVVQNRAVAVFNQIQQPLCTAWSPTAFPVEHQPFIHLHADAARTYDRSLCVQKLPAAFNFAVVIDVVPLPEFAVLDLCDGVLYRGGIQVQRARGLSTARHA